MNRLINLKLLNIKYIEKEKAYLLNGCEKNYKMIFSINPMRNMAHFQFKLRTIFIESIEVKLNNQIKKFTNINQDGFLVSFNYNHDDYKKNIITFTFYPKNICVETNEAKPKIYICKITHELYQTINLTNINWDNIFVINLKRRTDRKSHIIQMFKSNNIDQYEFIDAIDGLNPQILSQFNDLKLNRKTKIITSGHFACLLSHIKAIKEAKLRKYNSIMILEDDVILSHDFTNQLKSIKLPQYDMIYLGGIINKKKLFFSHWAINVKSILGAYGYILKSNLFDYVLNELSKLSDYVDLFYMKNIQPNYQVILLDDFVKTNLDSSDTSDKTLLVQYRLSYIKN